MNPITGAPSLPVSTGPATATVSLQSGDPWPGLAAAAERRGVPLPVDALARFDRYRDLLLAENAKFNLTAIREPDDVERRLFLNALLMVPEIDYYLAEDGRQLRRPARLVDVGSGAGLPGLALKIARPDIDVTLVDATAKKAAFMTRVIAELDLSGARAIHGRAEELGQDPSFRERFDLASARAVASLPVLLELVAPLLDIGGQAFLPKGTSIDEELRAGKRAARMLGAEIVSAELIPGGDTRLVIARKKTLTPRAFPRRPGIPNQSPLDVGA